VPLERVVVPRGEGVPVSVGVSHGDETLCGSGSYVKIDAIYRK
jgi:hypothetical protein